MSTMTTRRGRAILVTSSVLMLFSPEARAQQSPPDAGSVAALLGSQGFSKSVDRCLGHETHPDLVLVMDVEDDGRVFLVRWSPDTVEQMAVSCLASEVMKLAFPASSCRTTFSYSPATGEVQILEMEKREAWEDSFSKGGKLMFRGLVLSVVGDAFLTVAVALLPRMIVSSGGDEGRQHTWLVFDVLGLVAGVVMSFTGATFLELGYQMRRGAMEASVSGTPSSGPVIVF